MSPLTRGARIETLDGLLDGGAYGRPSPEGRELKRDEEANPSPGAGRPSPEGRELKP